VPAHTASCKNLFGSLTADGGGNKCAHEYQLNRVASRDADCGPPKTTPPQDFDKTRNGNDHSRLRKRTGNHEEVEADIAERERVEDDFGESHPAPPYSKQKLERARQQLLARRS
jgi:hypothetical protein